MKASELARIVGGKLLGEDVEVRRIAPLEEASEDALVIILDPGRASALRGKKVLCIVSTSEPQDVDYRCAVIVEDAAEAFTRLLAAFSQEPKFTGGGIHELAFVDETAEIADSAVIRPFAFVDRGAKIGENTVIHPFVYVGVNAEVGDDCVIYPFTFIGYNVRVGNRVILHAGVKLGADGFGFRRTDAGYEKIPQIGTVVIEDDVELGANVCVDRATIGKTVVSKGTKIDNLVQVGHNVKIGKNVVIAGNSGVAGSTIIEDDAVIAGFVGIADHLKVGRGAVITAKAGVHKNLEGGKTYAGFYVTEHMKFLKAYSLMLKLPEIYSKFRAMEARLKELEKMLKDKK